MSDYLSHLVARSLDRTEVIKPRLASFFEPSVQGEPVFGDESGSERMDASYAPDETGYDNLQSAWLSDQTPQLKSDALQPARSGSQQTPGQPRSGMTRQALPASSSSSVPPEVTAQSLKKTPQQKPSQDLPAPSGGDEPYVASPGAAAERSRASAHEPAIHPIPIESSPPALQEVPAQPPAAKVAQQELDHEMLTPPSSGGDETYVAAPGAAAERSRASAHEPAIQSIPIESSPPTLQEVTAQPSAVRMVQQESDHEMLTPLAPPSPGDGETYQPHRVTAERNRESTREPAIQPITIEQIVLPDKTQPRASEPAEPAAIRVTIGRVEVRATTPPQPPAPRTRPPGPALTLDDYLKKRNGGEL
ncbi:MAG: hypothetical protein C4B59_12540 [Candidatus Methanogaster sp.]|uniref:Uncharacterized protein n=1 Tax=Candidatus Methanogaster sp. TaxID=3386292 RepID=A0AC61L072_9EURY|nr:MAG: hypothetical protein C4B59_12540 [ANME-2 cluster archaeon]